MQTPWTVKTPIWRWALRGYVAGMLIVAAMNAASYLFRSNSIANLFGPERWTEETIGFPFILWQQGQTYGGWFVDYSAMAGNFLTGSIFGLFMAWIVVVNRDKLHQLVAELESDALRPAKRIQFSIRSLLVSTTVFAIAISIVTRWAGSIQLLWFVYLLGPATVLVIAFAPRHIRWQYRAVIVSCASAIVIAALIWTAHLRNMEYDKVLIGVFVFWTPQSAFAALALTSWFVWRDSILATRHSIVDV